MRTYEQDLKELNITAQQYDHVISFIYDLTANEMTAIAKSLKSGTEVHPVVKRAFERVLNIRQTEREEAFNIYNKESLPLYDVILKEKMLDTGLDRDEILTSFDLLNRKSAFPLDFQAENSAAIGFITEEAAEKINYDTRELQKMIQGILDDMEKESKSCEYEFKGLRIWLSR